MESELSEDAKEDDETGGEGAETTGEDEGGRASLGCCEKDARLPPNVSRAGSGSPLKHEYYTCGSNTTYQEQWTGEGQNVGVDEELKAEEELERCAQCRACMQYNPA